MIVSKNYYGIKGLFANFIKYMFMFLDFTGFRWAEYSAKYILHFRTALLSFLHLGNVTDGVYNLDKMVNQSLIEPIMGAGVLGFAVFIPCWIWSLIKPVFKPRLKKTVFIFAFAALFLINLIMLSYNLTYMVFSVRFIMSFIVISSPLLLYSYLSNKNPLKYFIILFALFYLMCVSTHIWIRPVIRIFKILKKHPSISYIRDVTVCKSYTDTPLYGDSVCLLGKKIKTTYTKENRILAFVSSTDNMFELKKMEFEGYKIDFGLMEKDSQIDFNKYNLIIIPSYMQASTLIYDYETRKNYYKIENHKLKILKRDPVPCYYVKNTLIPNGAARPPFQVDCALTPKFIIDNHFKIASFAGIIITEDPKIQNSRYFYILQNKIFKPKIQKGYRPGFQILP